jgi:PAS domain S-box-containing protein
MPLGSRREIRILHIDDEPDFADLSRRFLEREDDRFTVETATSADDGLERINDRPPDCVVSDYNMPGMDGLELLQAVREGYPDLPFILFTGKGSEAVASDAISAGVTDYLQKESGTGQYELLANRISNAVEAIRSAARAEQRRHRLEQILKTVPGCVVQSDADGQFVFANERAKEVLGLEADRLTQRAYNDPEWELETPDGEPIPDEELPFRQVRDTGEPIYDARHAITWPDGSRKILSVNAAPLLDETGTVESVVASLSDITDRMERRQESEEYRTIVEALADAVYVIDEEGQFTQVNDEFVDLVGYERETLIGNTPSLIKDDDTVERTERQLGQLLSSDGPDTVTLEVEIQPREGDSIVCEDHMGILPYDGEEFEGSVGVLRDITEHKEYEQGLEAQNERLEEFTGIVSHDLRSPLGVAEGHLELAEATGESEHLTRATEAVERSQALIHDLLTLARGGDQLGETALVDIAKVAENSWQTVETRQATLDANGSGVIEADRSRLQELFENLYRNAVEHGGDDVTVSVGGLSGGFYVADTGPGIPEAKREEVFEAGYSTADHGTGFGLRIVKQVADAHGWENTVTESEQDGARFEITGVERGE